MCVRHTDTIHWDGPGFYLLTCEGDVEEWHWRKIELGDKCLYDHSRVMEFKEEPAYVDCDRVGVYEPRSD